MSATSHRATCYSERSFTVRNSMRRSSVVTSSSNPELGLGSQYWKEKSIPEREACDGYAFALSNGSTILLLQHSWSGGGAFRGHQFLSNHALEQSAERSGSPEKNPRLRLHDGGVCCS